MLFKHEYFTDCIEPGASRIIVPPSEDAPSTMCRVIETGHRATVLCCNRCDVASVLGVYVRVGYSVWVCEIRIKKR